MIMFSEELKQLIDAAVTDGKVTEKEMKVIARRAKAEGVDMDELEIYIDSCLQKKTMECSEWNQVADRLFDYLEKAKKINAEERAERRKQKAQERAARRAFRAEHPDDFENTLKSIANVASDTVSGFASGDIVSKASSAAEVAKSLLDMFKSIK